MSSEPGEKARGRHWLVVAALLALPVLYVLSVGPVAMVCRKTGWNPAAVDVFYAPLQWLHDRTPLGEPLGWYVRLWRGR